jgi:hypothetical protein
MLTVDGIDSHLIFSFVSACCGYVLPGCQDRILMSRSSPLPDHCQQHGHGISVHSPSCVHFCNDDDSSIPPLGAWEWESSVAHRRGWKKRDGEEDTIMDSTWLVICHRDICGYPMGISLPFSCFKVKISSFWCVLSQINCP